MNTFRMLVLTLLAVATAITVLTPAHSAASGPEPQAEPVVIGMTGEFGLKDSFSAQAVELGILVALAEINARGGVLGGRPLALETRDDRSVPARAIDNMRDLLMKKDLVALFGARFSPVMLELLPHAQDAGLILLDPWASADGITAHDMRPNYAFRLSLKDSLAMPAMLGFAGRKGWKNVALVLPNTGWGRSNERAALAYLEGHPGVRNVSTRWYNWGDTDFSDILDSIAAADADALVLVANDIEGSAILRQMVAGPRANQLPVISHWGITGGKFFSASSQDLKMAELYVVQTFSFFKAPHDARERFASFLRQFRQVDSLENLEAPVGIGHAYDLTHILAMAIDRAGSTDRAAIRDALEQVGPYSGLTGTYQRPFTPDSHDAMTADHVFMARYREDGVIVPVE